MSTGDLKVRAESWSGGDTPLARRVARPMVHFLGQKTASGLLLLCATAVALLWANSPFADSYHQFWATEIEFAIGGWHPFEHHGHELSIGAWVNDALMVVFFFVVGLEIKTEMVVGDLSDPREAALPAIAALGGMLVPAGLYAAINLGGEGIGGWGAPMATDIAFAVGVLALLGPRVPQRLKLFVLALAIADDIGAIIVIALFYTASLDLAWLGAAAAMAALAYGMQRSRIWFTPAYVLIGMVVWYATFRSGVHATIAGVVMGLQAPARPLLDDRIDNLEDAFAGEHVDFNVANDLKWSIREHTAVTTRLIALLSPWASFFIIPVFALANAGVSLSGDKVTAALSSNITLGLVLGLVVGKPLGIWLATTLAVRFTSIELPPGLASLHVLGAGAVAGIGFTVALFISDLAFTNESLADEATIGILAASLLATLAGVAVLRRLPVPAAD